MQLFPNSAQLKNRFKWFRLIFLFLPALVALFLVIFFSFLYIPYIGDEAVWHIIEFQTQNDLFTAYSLKDDINNLLIDSYSKIISLSEKAEQVPLIESDFDTVFLDPRVLDAFCISFVDCTGFTCRNTLSPERLLTRLDVNGEARKEGRTTVHKTLASGVGLRRLTTDQADYLLSIRYFDPDSSHRGKGVVGIVLSRSEFLNELPELLDSITNNRTYFVLKNDSLSEYPEYQSIGLLDDTDTLWWRGDRTVKISEFK